MIQVAPLATSVAGDIHIGVILQLLRLEELVDVRFGKKAIKVGLVLLPAYVQGALIHVMLDEMFCGEGPEHPVQHVPLLPL